jgi:uncharacterized protein YbjQ (UPF0145 family)
MAKEKPICSVCGAKNTFMEPVSLSEIKGKTYCSKCGTKLIKEETKKIIATTTNNVEGYRVVEYIDVESVEVVIGTGVISEFSSSLADLLGERATAFERKLNSAKIFAMRKLKMLAFELDANAVIGIDMDYVDFTSNRIGVVANGTIVRIEKDN